MFAIYSKYIPFVVILTLLFTIGDLFLLYQNLQTIKANEAMLNHTNQVKLELKDVLQSLTNAETGQRGYLITGDDKFLRPFNQVVPILQKEMRDVKTITRDNPEQQKNIANLAKQTDQRIALLTKSIAIRNNEGLSSDALYSLMDQGRNSMIQIRRIIDAMLSVEDKLLNTRQQQTNTSFRRSFITSAVGGVLNFALILLSFYLINSEFRRRTELEKNKDDFISTASHELKTPLTSLNIYTQLASKKLEGGKITEAKNVLAKINDQTEKLMSLVTDLLDISRLETGKLKIEKAPFDLNEAIDETVESIQQTTKSHEIITKSKVRHSVYGDRYRIYQVITNLLTNAIKYSPEGGKIFITTKEKPKEVVISIKDQGIGIDSEHQKRIFEKLYRVIDSKEQTYPGFGIGLYICSEIIRQHRGKIWVESKKKKGSTFHFTLPLVK
jgi:signal transduction histidine kinase